MTKVHLYGKLAETFGDVHEFDVSSPAEACRALEANFPGRFYQVLREGSYRVVRGPDLDSGDPDTEETLNFNRDADIHISPEVSGSKSKGVGQIILGVVIVVAAVAGAWVTGGGSLAWGATALGGVTYGSIAMFGVSLILGGVAQMLAPTPDYEQDEGTNSNIFQGVENVTAQGVPVPLIMGDDVLVGSVVVTRTLEIGEV